MRFALCALWLAVALLVGCEEKPAESKAQIKVATKAKQKFESIAIGTSRDDVRNSLGQPAGIIYDAGKTQVLYSRRKTREITSIRIGDRKTWPVELKVFSKCTLRAPADYFSNGGVSALFIFGPDESTVCKEIHAS
jgi:hypothetical protein